MRVYDQECHDLHLKVSAWRDRPGRTPAEDWWAEHVANCLRICAYAPPTNELRMSLAGYVAKLEAATKARRSVERTLEHFGS
jgi:ectoine hydroxylase-related dioxygenase (phytanoyl-CoA dioxygenase family)